MVDALKGVCGLNDEAISWAEGSEVIEADEETQQSSEIERQLAELPPIGTPIVRREDLPPRSPVQIEGLLRIGRKALLSGGSKCNKSWLLMQLAVAVATGGRWLGKQCAQGRVLLVDFELHEDTFRNRLIEVIEAMDADPEVVKENLDPWVLVGHSAPLQSLVDVIVHASKGRDYSLIILDPLYKIQTGDENSAEAIGGFFNAVDKLCSQLECSVFICHHHSKGLQGSKSSLDRSSGSGVFGRAPDLILDLNQLVLNEAAQEARKTLHYSKEATGWRIEATLRDFAPHEPMHSWHVFPLHKEDYSCTLNDCGMLSSTDGRKATKAKNLSKTEKAIIRAMEDSGECMSKEIEESLEITRNTLRSRVEQSSLFEWVGGGNGSKPAKIRMLEIIDN